MIGDVAVPRAAGVLLAVPPLDAYGAAMRSNHAAAAAWTFRVGSRPAAEWRTLARQELGPGGADRLLVTGHQPDLYHAGVWVKNFVVDAVCRRVGAAGLNLVVDTDLASSHVRVPAIRDGVWQAARVLLPGVVAGRPWETQPPLERARWERFVADVAAALDTLGEAGRAVCDTFGEFAHRVPSSPLVLAATNLADSLARARRLWEGHYGEPIWAEQAVSAMAGSTAFSAFVGHVLADLPRFWTAYNDSLMTYRKLRRIRTNANPVPDLRRRGDLWETPFWYLHPDGDRRGLFAERQGDRCILQSRDSTLGTLDGDRAAWGERIHAIPGIRPRALTLTMFTRLALADLFVHGVGGAHYDRVTDDVVRGFFGIEPPVYAAASLTLPLPLEAAGSAEEPRDLRRHLRDLRWNPQRHAHEMDGVTPDVATLSERKARLVEALGIAATDRAGLTREIRVINGALADHLASARQRIALRLADAEASCRDRAVAQSREYPYFLYRPQQLASLIVAGV